MTEVDLPGFVTRRANNLFRAEREVVWIHEADSVRGPGWYEAVCHEHEWETTGREPVVEEARDAHITDQHDIGRLLAGVYGIVDGYRKAVAAGCIDTAYGPALRLIARQFPDAEGYQEEWGRDE